MNTEHQPDKHSETTLFGWLEEDLRDLHELQATELRLRQQNPTLYNIIASAAAELAPNDPKSHATYFGSFLLLLSEINTQPESIKLTPATTIL